MTYWEMYNSLTIRLNASSSFIHPIVFGSLECDDIPGDVIPPSQVLTITDFIGRNRGIQGYQNSCYMDATLFSMFAFSSAFDYLLKSKAGSSVNTDRVQLVLRQGIVNPLRKSVC